MGYKKERDQIQIRDGEKEYRKSEKGRRTTARHPIKVPVGQARGQH